MMNCTLLSSPFTAVFRPASPRLAPLSAPRPSRCPRDIRPAPRLPVTTKGSRLGNEKQQHHHLRPSFWSPGGVFILDDKPPVYLFTQSELSSKSSNSGNLHWLLVNKSNRKRFLEKQKGRALVKIKKTHKHKLL